MDTSFLIAHAERCRSLAENADEFTKRRLLDLAAHYDKWLAGAEPSVDRGYGGLDTTAAAPSVALATDSGTAGDGITGIGTVNIAGLEAGATGRRRQWPLVSISLATRSPVRRACDRQIGPANDRGLVPDRRRRQRLDGR